MSVRMQEATLSCSKGREEVILGSSRDCTQALKVGLVEIVFLHDHAVMAQLRTCPAHIFECKPLLKVFAVAGFRKAHNVKACSFFMFV